MGKLIPTIKTVFLKSISGAKTKCRKSYIIPTVELQLEVIVLHHDTNDLRRRTPDVIARETVDLGTSAKTEKNAVIYQASLRVKIDIKTKQEIPKNF